MSTSTLSVVRLTASGVAGLALLAAAAGLSGAAPTADSQGYVDSTARCSAPAVAVLFGSTSSSRIAICKDASGGYEYRGVRIRDGAKLVLTATASGGGYVAESDGVTYTVTPNTLKVTAGGTLLRSEPLTDVHEPQGASTSTSTSTSGTTTVTTTVTSSTVPTSTTPTTTTPLPPPLPAEVGAR
ncbi:hypothetical protein SBI67_13535 [Mycolicibacterium sp. 120266]|uniref:hypothetical protein n=1 Tax=Mycolicibacterium sp. 120266 TaxID=3090601 RepID=UPI00299EA1FA|nr:hypothetical protein [Mycolicibacterium sp. 120266]MDX1873148.1 hypothetical protein [Mycolicibacterium sp. 120266]